MPTPTYLDRAHRLRYWALRRLPQIIPLPADDERQARWQAASDEYERLISEASDDVLREHDSPEARAELRRRLSISAQAPSPP